MNTQPITNSTENTNEESASLTITNKLEDKIKNNSFITNPIASQGPFMPNNTFGAGRSLS